MTEAEGTTQEARLRGAVLILDFGSQYTQLIARRVREQQVYCEIHPYNLPLEMIRRMEPSGMILSGGPASIYQEHAPRADARLLQGPVPVLGICYGMQWIVQTCGGRVVPGQTREYGFAEIEPAGDSDLFYGLRGPDARLTVWMSHGDRIEALPPGFCCLAGSRGAPVAACSRTDGKVYGLQFHPEVQHTPQGVAMLRNFLFRICGCRPDWTMQSFVENAVRSLRETIRDGHVLCALSGGVDSAVVAVLLHRAVENRLTCIFVDNGLLREGEGSRVREVFQGHLGIPLRYVDAAQRFLGELRGVEDPEEKRRIIGREFIRVFEEEAAGCGEVRFLAQGTLYPDVIESVSLKGPSAVIKSHHNVGGLPETMNLILVEPLRELFKDEVRQVGKELGLPDRILQRQPFPGPGLAVRILGEVTRERLAIVRKADAVVQEEIRSAGLYEAIWQAFAVLLPVRTVGVMGDERTYEHVVAVRAVQSLDGMTADWVRLPPELLATVSSRIINEVPGVNRVVYDISSKPPSTIEWE